VEQQISPYGRRLAVLMDDVIDDKNNEISSID
jgi:hypothetical protein